MQRLITISVPLAVTQSGCAKKHSAPTYDVEDAKRGVIASDPELRVTMEDGKTIWNMAVYDFVSVASDGDRGFLEGKGRDEK